MSLTSPRFGPHRADSARGPGVRSWSGLCHKNAPMPGTSMSRSIKDGDRGERRRRREHCDEPRLLGGDGPSPYRRDRPTSPAARRPTCTIVRGGPRPLRPMSGKLELLRSLSELKYVHYPSLPGPGTAPGGGLGTGARRPLPRFLPRLPRRSSRQHPSTDPSPPLACRSCSRGPGDALQLVRAAAPDTM